MLIVLYSLHLAACGFYGIGIILTRSDLLTNILCCIFHYTTALIFQLVHHLTLAASLLRTSLLFFIFLMACFTSVDVMGGGGGTFIIDFCSCYPVISIIVIPYTQSKCLLVVKKHGDTCVHCSRCLRNVSTIP